MTPLNSILNLSDLLITKAKDHISQADGQITLSEDDLLGDIDTLKVINSSTQMMKMMNQSLLDSQAIADGNLRLCFRVMSPLASIEQLVEFFKIQIQAKSINVEIKTDETKQNFPRNMVCDNARFQEMVFHILANAIKFNKEMHGEIEIILAYEVKKDGNGGGILKCSIIDTGIGMTQT
jgi:signal transduction histidine kinase